MSDLIDEGFLHFHPNKNLIQRYESYDIEKNLVCYIENIPVATQPDELEGLHPGGLAEC